VAEPRITAAALAHLLLCSRELLQKLLIDTTSRPRRIKPSQQQGPIHRNVR
jgi:hypothetical protein